MLNYQRVRPSNPSLWWSSKQKRLDGNDKVPQACLVLSCMLFGCGFTWSLQIATFSDCRKIYKGSDQKELHDRCWISGLMSPQLLCLRKSDQRRYPNTCNGENLVDRRVTWPFHWNQFPLLWLSRLQESWETRLADKQGCNPFILMGYHAAFGFPVFWWKQNIQQAWWYLVIFRWSTGHGSYHVLSNFCRSRSSRWNRSLEEIWKIFEHGQGGPHRKLNPT